MLEFTSPGGLRAKIPYYIDPKVFWLIPINLKLMCIVDTFGITLYYNPISDDFKGEDEEAKLLTIADAMCSRQLIEAPTKCALLRYFADKALDMH